jgi:hypothetical protein
MSSRADSIRPDVFCQQLTSLDQVAELLGLLEDAEAEILRQKQTGKKLIVGLILSGA